MAGTSLLQTIYSRSLGRDERESKFLAIYRYSRIYYEIIPTVSPQLLDCCFSNRTLKRVFSLEARDHAGTEATLGEREQLVGSVQQPGNVP